MRSRLLQLENLEQRQPLAGNVTVALSGGSVTVTGDEAGNDISIYQQPNGRFNIIGNDGEVISGPTTDLLIRNLTVNLGDGNDAARIGTQTDQPFPAIPAQIVGRTVVNGGSGANEIFVLVNGGSAEGQIMPAASITVDTTASAPGDNTAELDDFVAVANSSAANITIRTGDGNDNLQAGGLIAGRLSINAGPDSTPEGQSDNDELTMSVNKVGIANISLGGGSNRLTSFSNLFGSLSVATGSGDDAVGVTTSVVAFNLGIHTNGGADTVFLDEVFTGISSESTAALTAFGVDLSQLPFDLAGLLSGLPTLPGRLAVSTGDGDDLVYAMRLTSTLGVNIALNSGDDTLYATDIDALFSLFNGGLGTDGKYSENIEGANTFLSFEEELENPFPSE